jgi:hypothetical protein
VVIGTALLCWNQIARTLSGVIFVSLAYGGGDPKLAAPSGGTASVRDFSINSVTVGLTHLSSQLQWMIAGNIILQFLLFAAVLLTMGIVWIRTSTGHPFAPVVTHALVALALLVAVAGSGIEVLQSLILSRETIEAVGSSTAGLYYDQNGFSFSGLSIIIAFGISVLASAFAIGARLTKDTDGLV